MNRPCVFGRPLALAVAGVLAAGCALEIQHELSESEANEIMVLLDQNGIVAKKLKEEGGRELTWALSVAKQDAARAARLLKENELPRPKSSGFEVFSQGGLIPTATEERAKFLQSLSGELSRTLRSIDGVLLARVHINIPEVNELTDVKDKPQPSASVLIKYRNYATAEKPPTPAPMATRQVQDLVSRAVQDLRPESVTVVMMPGLLPGSSSATVQVDFVDVVGLRMARESALQFKIMMIVVVLVIVLLTGYIISLHSRGLREAVPKRS